MAQSLYTESIESATLTLTNGGANSDEKLLKHRDLRKKGINVDSPTSSTVALEIDYGAATTVDYAILGNLTTSLGVGLEFFYWTGAWTSDGTVGAATYTNQNLYYAFAASRSATKYKIEFDPTSVSTIELGCVFIGAKYTFPVSYQLGSPRKAFRRGDKLEDFFGYPYSQTYNTANKFEWNIQFNLNETQLQALETQMETAHYDKKPFFFFDSLHDNNYHLVKLNTPSLPSRQRAATYFYVNFNVSEL